MTECLKTLALSEEVTEENLTLRGGFICINKLWRIFSFSSSLPNVLLNITSFTVLRNVKRSVEELSTVNLGPEFSSHLKIYLMIGVETLLHKLWFVAWASSYLCQL